jgi:ankyrin repeat protein
MAQAEGALQRALIQLVRAVTAGDLSAASRMLADEPRLATAASGEGASRASAKPFYLDEIGHYLYAGDTALHIAAAGYRQKIARKLVASGADVRARNRRGAEPLHYAADGAPGAHTWNPRAQAATIAALIAAGADPNAADCSGVAPLHRAVRTRCAEAVRALLENGADARRRNKSGSTPMQLAIRATGRGGSGSQEAKAQQAEIIGLLREHGAGR